ncbi:MAG: tRNA pseudouridine(38-40) synthase TruA, partial [Chloroflexi bacterium]|nr:tRNA pseudouridine(38-40) synthase TruA [Chloroflexota bacterium]
MSYRQLKTRYGALLAYDGTAYQGFQRQPAPNPTIQAAVEAALGKVCGRDVRIVAAGRTDAGVHAAGQVIAFDVTWRHSESELQRAVNAQLPMDIALKSCWLAPGFHPRYDALWRQYAYRINTPAARNPLTARYEWQLAGMELDGAGMQAAAEHCLGERDFAAFGTPPQASSSNTIRQVFESRWSEAETESGSIYTYRIRGTAFLYHMVRRMVGTMVSVGRGRLNVGEFADILHSRDLQRAKGLAPPQGLTLEAVEYPPGIWAAGT